MDDLVRWLGEQLDADTARATAAAEEGGADWRYDGDAVVTRRERDLVAIGSQDYMEAGRGEFIAAWSPARVLREIDAKRRIVDAHERRPMPKGDTADCAQCWGAVWPCPTLRLLALPYDDRDGYQEAWRP